MASAVLKDLEDDFLDILDDEGFRNSRRLEELTDNYTIPAFRNLENLLKDVIILDYPTIISQLSSLS